MHKLRGQTSNWGQVAWQSKYSQESLQGPAQQHRLLRAERERVWYATTLRESLLFERTCLQANEADKYD